MRLIETREQFDVVDLRRHIMHTWLEHAQRKKKIALMLSVAAEKLLLKEGFSAIQ